MNWFDIERMGWEEGDVICGLVVVGDEQVGTGAFRLVCDAGAAGSSEEVEVIGGRSRPLRGPVGPGTASAPLSRPLQAVQELAAAAILEPAPERALEQLDLAARPPSRDAHVASAPGRARRRPSSTATSRRATTWSRLRSRSSARRSTAAHAVQPVLVALARRARRTGPASGMPLRW